MSKEQKRLMRFLIRYPNSWHTFAPSMRRTVKTLETLGVEINEFRQMRLLVGEKLWETAQA